MLFQKYLILGPTQFKRNNPLTSFHFCSSPPEVNIFKFNHLHIAPAGVTEKLKFYLKLHFSCKFLELQTFFGSSKKSKTL